MSVQDAEVLIVGGGIVGLSAAVFLTGHGMSVELVERRPDALAHPRARVINPRAVELYRQVGLEPAIQAARSRAEYSSGLVIRAETLSAPGRTVTEMQSSPDPGRDDNISTAPWIPIDQDQLERVVRDRATQMGARIHFSTELTAFSRGPDGITADVRDLRSGSPRHVRARYLIAADGHRSGIRQQLGIPVRGPGLIGHTLCFVFEADLSGPLRGRHLAVGHFNQPRPGTSLISHSEGRWVFSVPFRPDQGEPLSSFTDERCAELARAAVGDPSVRIKIVPQLANGVTTLDYELGAQVAERYQDGPVFLAGDAAHVMPPAGAFGAGTGIQDAHNLAWKLAATAAGRAGPGLLATYQAERQPVAMFTLAQSLHLLRERTGRDIPYDQGGPPVSYEEVLFGHRYGEGALAPEEHHGSGSNGNGDGRRFSMPPAQLTGVPGTRAPHVALLRQGREISTLDLYGSRCVLMCGPAGGRWAEAMSRLAAPRRLAADTYQLGTDLADPGARWEQAHGVTASGAILIRPDGFVAWRARDEQAGDLCSVLVEALVRSHLTVPAAVREGSDSRR
jgi:putative polyketide hydroxylase